MSLHITLKTYHQNGIPHCSFCLKKAAEKVSYSSHGRDEYVSYMCDCEDSLSYNELRSDLFNVEQDMRIINSRLAKRDEDVDALHKAVETLDSVVRNLNGEQLKVLVRILNERTCLKVTV